MKAHSYEGLFILRLGLPADEMTKAREEIDRAIVEAKGKIKGTRDLGKRPLSYPVKKRTEGHYINLDFDIDPGKLGSLSRTYRLNPKILRYMITIKTDRMNPPLKGSEKPTSTKKPQFSSAGH